MAVGGDGLDALRRRAESALAEGAARPADEALADARVLLQELQVHQAELEMQNEELGRTQRALEASRRGWFELFEHAPICYLAADRQGLVRRANAAAEALLGLPRQTLLGWALDRLVADGEQVRLHDLAARAWAAGGNLADGFRFRRHGALPFHGRLECRPLFAGPADEVLLCAVVDLTPVQEAMERLARSEEHLRRLFEASNDGLLVVDPVTQRVAEGNPSAGALLGVPVPSLAGRDLDGLVLAPYREAAVALVQRAASAQGRLPPAQMALRGPDGGAVPVELSASRVAGGAGLVLLLARDLTERLRAEEERRLLTAQVERLQRLDALGRTAGAVAHELNNVLAVVLAAAGAARHDPGPEGVEALSDVLSAARRGRDLTQRLLGFARAVPRHPGPQPPAALLDEVAGLVRRLAGARVRVEVTAPADLPAVLGDHTQLVQALLNLGLNAVDALGDRGGHLWLRAAALTLAAADLPPGLELAPGAYVRLEAQDDGPGFDDVSMAHAFEPFFTTKPAGKGTGLGLAMAWSVAREHGGFAAVDSPAGRGACVSIVLPAFCAAPREAAPPPAGPRVGAPAPGDATSAPAGLVLVIDDEASLRNVLARLLKRAGWAFRVAADGPEGVEAFEAERDRVAVVLLDLTMPGMSGLEVLRHLREADPGVPVLLLSGYAVERVPAEVLAQPATAFVAKPFEPDEVLAQVKALARRPSRPAAT